MRISDWSSDVCSSDLALHDLRGYELKGEEAQHHAGDAREDLQDRLEDLAHPGPGVFREVDRRPEAQGCSHRHGDHGDEQGARHDRLDVVHAAAWEPARSEEHTSELKSLMRISYAVFCLTKNNNKHTNY